VDGGVMTIAFIDYLAHYITKKSPTGWTIVSILLDELPFWRSCPAKFWMRLLDELPCKVTRAAWSSASLVI